MGAKAVPSFQDLYTYSEEQPRFAALQAGAKLNDAMVVPPLLDMARTGSHENRVGAIELLGAMGHNPAIDVGLRPLLDDPDVDIRLKTFEALEKRRTWWCWGSGSTTASWSTWCPASSRWST